MEKNRELYIFCFEKFKKREELKAELDPYFLETDSYRPKSFGENSSVTFKKLL